jgi:hypothetical protein
VEDDNHDNKHHERVNLGSLPPGMSSSTALRSTEATYGRAQGESRSLDPEDDM